MLESILLTIATAATPLLLAAIGELVVERSGVLNLGVEGMMLMGAVIGFGAALSTGNPWIGVFAAILAGMAFSMLFAVLALSLATNQVATGLSLTLTNPATIMAFIAIFAGFGLGGTLDRLEASTLVLGVFIGSSLWWITLSMGVAAVRHRISDRGLIMLNHCTGVALGLFGLCLVGLGISIWPDVIPARVSIWEAAAPRSSQIFMLVGAVVLVPVILAYTVWAYWVFRGKVGDEGYH